MTDLEKMAREKARKISVQWGCLPPLLIDQIAEALVEVQKELTEANAVIDDDKSGVGFYHKQCVQLRSQLTAAQQRAEKAEDLLVNKKLSVAELLLILSIAERERDSLKAELEMYLKKMGDLSSEAQATVLKLAEARSENDSLKARVKELEKIISQVRGINASTDGALPAIK